VVGRVRLEHLVGEGYLPHPDDVAFRERGEGVLNRAQTLVFQCRVKTGSA
jgi:hypothetical protein